VAGPFKGTDGKWWLLRIKTSPVEHPKPLDDLLRTTVKNALLDRKRQLLMQDLEVALRPKAKIEVFDDALAKIAVPEFK
jgi:hypothetical protein